MMRLPRTGIVGHLIDTPSFGDLRSIPDGAVVLESGEILAVGRKQELDRLDGVEWVESGAARPVIYPGLVDVHAHLPQYPVVAKPESGLLPWLERQVFPQEMAFQGEGTRAQAVGFFSDLMANGTTSSMLYSAVWEDSVHIAFEEADRCGIRATIGKVMMDEGSYGTKLPDRARERSVNETRRLAERWHEAAGGRLRYAVSPRFAVTCSRLLMEEAAAIASEFGCPLQTHLAENTDEIETVRQRFPEAVDYTDVYDQAGLLREGMVLGHCIHLSDREIETIARSGAAVAHCPTSNFFLNSGLMPLDRLLDAGIPVGLGSDVAGGPELNLWQVMREAVNAQKARHFANGDVPMLSPAEALYLATMGGAEATGLAAMVGQLEAGKKADLLVMDLAELLPLQGGGCAQPNLSPEQVVALCIYRGGPHAVSGVWIDGVRKI